jgi:HSP20 family protein
MFEIIQRPRAMSPLRELMSMISEDPFFQPVALGDESGTLPLDIVEGEDELIVRASLPGFRKSDVEVHIEKGVLSINASHAEDKESKSEKYYRRERRVGSVSRRVSLPGLVSEDKAQATLENGELTIRIPRADAAKPRQIAVK